MLGDEIGQHHVFRPQAVGKHHRRVFPRGLLQHGKGDGDLLLQFTHHAAPLSTRRNSGASVSADAWYVTEKSSKPASAVCGSLSSRTAKLSKPTRFSKNSWSRWTSPIARSSPR